MTNWLQEDEAALKYDANSGGTGSLNGTVGDPPARLFRARTVRVLHSETGVATTTSYRTAAIAPMLSVRNGAKAFGFYNVAFGAREVFRIEDESGSVVARLSVGGADF